MRFSHHIPIEGEERFRKRFLWLPKRIGEETRWLELGRWHEVYSERRWKGEEFWQPLAWFDPD